MDHELLSVIPDDPTDPVRPSRFVREPSPRTGKPLSGVRVVVVDDNADSLEMLSTALAVAGATVTACDSAEEAFRAIEAEPPHVLLSDIAMPQRDGYWLIEQVHAWAARSRRRIRAAAITAHGSAASRAKVLRAGYDHYLSKPVSVTALVELVLEMVHRS
jgi:CheY-like chemotaxis protein